MLSFFLKIMNQKCGSYVCVQLLQTLNILFENIRNETSICKYISRTLYHLLATYCCIIKLTGFKKEVNTFHQMLLCLRRCHMNVSENDNLAFDISRWKVCVWLRCALEILQSVSSNHTDPPIRNLLCLCKIMYYDFIRDQ